MGGVHAVSRNPPRPTFIKASVKVQHQCYWCGHDSREGTHGVQVDRPDGGVNINCTVTMMVQHPAKVWRIDGVTT